MNTTYNHKSRTLSFVVLTAVLVFAAGTAFSVARAEDSESTSSVSASTSASSATSSKAGRLRLELEAKASAQKRDIEDKMFEAKKRAGQELDRRVASLNKLIGRLNEAKRVSAGVKTELSGDITELINSLTALNTKIQSNTSTSTLKADIQSITGSYRVYLLVIPKGHLLAAADRIKVTADLMATTSVKLKTAIATAKSGGKDVASLETLLADANAKIADSKVQADAAIALLTPLKPDEKNNVVFEANKKALMDARAKIKAGSDDLKTARDAMHKIYSSLKGSNVRIKASASSSAEVD